jgi:hypothetical protein
VSASHSDPFGGRHIVVADEKPEVLQLGRTRSIAWQGQHFYFERLQHRDTPAENSSQWAVSRRGEFIGAMACPTEVATADFDVRCLRWLADLLA